MIEVNKEYAEALFELAKENSIEEEILNQLNLVSEQLNTDYTQLLSSPNIPMHERLKLIDEAFSQEVHDYVLSFIQLLCENGYIRHFNDCVKEYYNLYKNLANVSSARIVSAVELTDSEKNALITKLEKLTNNTVRAEYETDTGIIGGIVVYIDGKIIDGSIRSKLKNVKEVIDK